MLLHALNAVVLSLFILALLKHAGKPGRAGLLSALKIRLLQAEARMLRSDTAAAEIGLGYGA
ncbi:MAG: hypothetical protein ACI8W8_001839 [Rhodothermales bacterium]|jgi:hypothetical protein